MAVHTCVSSTWGSETCLQVQASQPGLCLKTYIKNKIQILPLNLGLRPTRVDDGFPVSFHSHLFMKGCVFATGDSVRRDAGPRTSHLTGLQYPYTSHQSCVPEKPLVIHLPVSLAQNPAKLIPSVPSTGLAVCADINWAHRLSAELLPSLPH